MTLLSDAAADRAAVLAALDSLMARTSQDDTIFLFYSGHGHFGEDGTYYLTTHDTQLTAASRVVADTAVSQGELIARLQALPARRMLPIFNACHAGALSPTLGDDTAPVSGENLRPNSALRSWRPARADHCHRLPREPVRLRWRRRAHDLARRSSMGYRGKGQPASVGTSSAFDLYTQVYFTVGEAVQRIPIELRRRYSERQEPELTVLKGVGPFAVALYPGATTLGSFSAPQSLAEGMAVREVSEAYSRAMLQQISASGGGDAAGRDIVKPGGDYAGGNIDKRQGTFVQGDQFNLAGSFHGANVNIKSQVSQHISGTDTNLAARDELRRLVEQLSSELAHAPPGQAADAEAVAELAQQLVAQATKDTPNPMMVQISAAGLRQAAEHLGTALPRVLILAQQIGEQVGRFNVGLAARFADPFGTARQDLVRLADPLAVAACRVSRPLTTRRFSASRCRCRSSWTSRNASARRY